MSAIPEDFIKKTAQLSSEVTRPFPKSRKIYVQGSRDDLRVPMREIEQSDTPASFGTEKNPAITVYDTSGPFSDPEVMIDLLKGMPDVRGAWIAERGDTAALGLGNLASWCLATIALGSLAIAGGLALALWAAVGLAGTPWLPVASSSPRSARRRSRPTVSG